MPSKISKIQHSLSLIQFQWVCFLVDFLFKLWLERLDIISVNDFDDTAIYMECVCAMKHGFTWTKHRLHRTTSAAKKPCPRASKVWDYFTQRPSMWCPVSLANLIVMQKCLKQKSLEQFVKVGVIARQHHPVQFLYHPKHDVLRLLIYRICFCLQY